MFISLVLFDEFISSPMHSFIICPQPKLSNNFNLEPKCLNVCILHNLCVSFIRNYRHTKDSHVDRVGQEVDRFS